MKPERGTLARDDARRLRLTANTPVAPAICADIAARIESDADALCAENARSAA